MKKRLMIGVLCLLGSLSAAVSKEVYKNFCREHFLEVVNSYKPFNEFSSDQKVTLYKGLRDRFYTLKKCEQQELLDLQSEWGFGIVHKTVFSDHYVEGLFFLSLGFDPATKTKDGETVKDVALRLNARFFRQLIAVWEICSEVRDKAEEPVFVDHNFLLQYLLDVDNGISIDCRKPTDSERVAKAIHLLFSLSEEDRKEFFTKHGWQLLKKACEDIYFFGKRHAGSLLFILFCANMYIDEALYAYVRQFYARDTILITCLGMYRESMYNPLK